jgi:hypothetical protein
MMCRAAAALVLGFFLQYSALPARAQSQVDGKTALTELLSGYSLRGKDWIEYYSPNGTIRGKARYFGMVRSYIGQWSANEKSVCYDYEGTSYDTCSRLMVDGDRVYHYNISGILKADGIATRQFGNRLDDF